MKRANVQLAQRQRDRQTDRYESDRASLITAQSNLHMCESVVADEKRKNLNEKWKDCKKMFGWLQSN